MAVTTAPSLHALLLLSDSALPLGSFAFSSGLESFLAHNHHTSLHSNPQAKLTAFDKFLAQSISNVASTSLPYVLTAFHHPSQLPDLDNDFDASTPCTVARRASITQGRALIAVWERALSASANVNSEASIAVSTFATQLKSNAVDAFGMHLQAHFPPLFGGVCSALGLPAHETSYLFLLNHAKAVLSAGVRASVMGPYQSQATLASGALQDCINACIAGQSRAETRAEDAVVTVPTMDLWMGRHELLYSRIFNS
ncbi:urease accessory protein UreF [Zymoseptoria brevis]|uniref:Urease accessory protein UreF n=1 Tax=Zymoseptoria brevis TaxID=1047168 RepID=A0A0F4GQD6_9PEZI|nr:urease accessory protein UreF [Zymoseptoria brevis]